MLLLGLATAFAAILSLHIASAFNPTWDLVIGYQPLDDDPVTTKGGKSQWGRPHEAMTKRGVSIFYQPWFGRLRATSSMDKARREIIKGTILVDKHGDSEAELAEAHCDDEKLRECHDRLKNAKSDIKNMLEAGDVTNARIKLGRMLHTVQDFYAHSNWVEMGHRSPDQISLKLSWEWPLEFDVAPINVQSCQDCGYDGVPPSKWLQQRLSDEICRKYVSSSDPLSILSKVVVAVCIKAKEWFSSHVPPNCRDNLLPDLSSENKKYLTSGYFGTNYTLRKNKPPHKCSHGGPFDRDATGREGISKDTSSPFMSPHWYEHKYAAALADRATVQYIGDVREELCGMDRNPKDCVLLRPLFGVRPILTRDAFVNAFLALPVGEAAATSADEATDALAALWDDVIPLMHAEMPTTSRNPKLQGRAEQNVSFAIPVDSSLGFIGITLNESLNGITVTNPAGAVVSDTTPGVTILAIGTTVMYTVDAPTLHVGEWTVSITGDAAFSLSVLGESTLQFSTFNFVSFNGARHDGWFPMEMEEIPPPGSQVWAHAIIEGNYSNREDVEFEFRAKTGPGRQLLGKITMINSQGESDDQDYNHNHDGDLFVTPRNYYYGKTTIPKEAFNVYVVGEDINGVPFQRLAPGPGPGPGPGISDFFFSQLEASTVPAQDIFKGMIPTSMSISENSTATITSTCPTYQLTPSLMPIYELFTAGGVSGQVWGGGTIAMLRLVMTAILMWNL